MIPPPVDPALLREHAYADTGNLEIVLNPKTFTDFGGFKSIEKYGLGYFNYMFALDKRVTEVSIKDILRCHIYKHFNFYFVILVMLTLMWLLSLTIYAESFKEKISFDLGRSRSHKKKSGEISYDHVQV